MTVSSAIRSLLFLMALVVLWGSGAYAQSEVDPDHFESPNKKPFPQPKPHADSQEEMRYEGRFALPYSLLCGGNRLAPGKYSISLRSDGKVAQALLRLRGQGLTISGVAQKQSHKRTNNALIVENKGKVRTLSIIQMAEFDFIIDPDYQVDTSSKCKTRRFERLPLTLLSPNSRHGTTG
jgi:hypothetical protein